MLRPPLDLERPRDASLNLCSVYGPPTSPGTAQWSAKWHDRRGSLESLTDRHSAIGRVALVTKACREGSRLRREKVHGVPQNKKDAPRNSRRDWI